MKMAEKKKILIIEDEADIAKVTAFRLVKSGFDVVIAEDGKIGLDMVKNEKPDLVLLDLGLPKISGKDVCKTIKAADTTKSIPVVILSASSEGINEILEEIKAENYIIKPYEPVNLINIVKKYVFL